MVITTSRRKTFLQRLHVRETETFCGTSFCRQRIILEYMIRREAISHGWFETSIVFPPGPAAAASGTGRCCRVVRANRLVFAPHRPFHNSRGVYVQRVFKRVMTKWSKPPRQNMTKWHLNDFKRVGYAHWCHRSYRCE